ncbi:ribonuclease H-like domain-containing protein [Tanacetum coccineum]
MTSSSADESQNHPEKTQTQNVQQIVTTTVSNNNAKFPYLKKDEYETWAMKMEYWIMNSDHHLWNVVLNGNSKKNVGRDPKGNIIILPPVSAEEQIAVQRETKARTLLLQSLPEDHMADFHHLDDARDIWLAVKARFGGNEESKKMRKSMLKQEFQEFRVSEDEGLHKGYDRFQKILSQLNQLQAKPDNEDCNIKFLRALPSSWSQVAITLKAKGGLDYLNFDDLYNKLKSLEIDIKGGSSYKSNHSAAPSHSAFVSTTSGNNKMSYAETSKQSSSYISASPGSNVSHFNSGNVMEDVLHSFVAESDQQIIYEDFDQIGKLDLEELDIKWQMAMLSVRVNRFEKKAGRKMNFNNRDAARFDKKKVRCYKCSQLGHFARECTGKQVESNARYSAFKIKELEQDKPADPKALLSVDSMVNWSDHEESADENASQVYGMIAGRDDEDEVAGEFALMGVTSQVQTCPFGCHDKYAELKKEFDDLEVQYKEYYIQVQAYKNTLKTLEQQKAWYQSNQLAYEEKVKVLKRDLENTTNLLKYSESINNNVNLEKQELQTKLDNTLARFAKWKESSKNLAKLVDSSMTIKTKLGLGYEDYTGEDEIYYPTMPSIFDTTLEDVDVTSPQNPKPMTLPYVTFPDGSVNVPAPIPAGRQTGPAPVYAGTPVPAGRQNRPAPVHADRPFPAGRRNSVSVSAGWRNNAARPMSRPTSSYFQNYSRPVYYDQMYMGEGRWGTAVKSSAGCSWRDSRPYLQRGSKNNGGSQQSTWKNLIQVLKIHTDENVADLLSKAFDGPRFNYLVFEVLKCGIITPAGSTWFLLLVRCSTGSSVVPAGRLIFLLVVSCSYWLTTFPAGFEGY